MSSGSWPSHSCTDQPEAANRAFWSVTSARLTLPSIEMPLSSHITISRREPLLAGEPDRLVADPLHQAAVAGDHPGVVVDDLPPEARRQALLGDRHADRVGEPLAERPGRRLDPRGVAVLRDARRCASRAGGSARARRSSCRRSRSGTAARRAASTRARPTARSGRGPASRARRRRTSGACSNRTVATSAMPIGRPGCPEFAFCTASIASTRKRRRLHPVVGVALAELGDVHRERPFLLRAPA